MNGIEDRATGAGEVERDIGVDAASVGAGGGCMERPAHADIDVSLVADTADRGRLQSRANLPFVDALRGIAILMVVWVHHSQNFAPTMFPVPLAAYGQMGVQLFFVASAFTLCRSASARRAEPHPVISFYLRRFFRIAPLYYLGIACYAALFALLGETANGARGSPFTAANVIANLTFLHGLKPSAVNNVVPGGWSISVEMLFYLAFPAVFALFSVLYRRRRWATVVGTVALAVVLNLAAQYYFDHRSGTVITTSGFSYYFITNQFAVFLVGISAFFLIEDDEAGRPSVVRDLLCFVVFTAAAFAMLAIGSPIAAMFLPLIASVSFAFLLNLLRTRYVRAGYLARIGEVSYSMYVFHFLFAWLFTRVLLATGAAAGIADGWLYLPTLLLSIAFSYAVAWVSKRLIEDRFIALGKALIRWRDGRAISLRAQ